MSSGRLTLADLPQFTVSAVEFGDGDRAKIAGKFNSNNFIDGLRLRNGRGWLYVSRPESITGDVTGFDESNLAVVFKAQVPKYRLAPGQRFPFLDGHWNPQQVAIVLDGTDSWNRVGFRPSGAVEYRDPKTPVGLSNAPPTMEQMCRKAASWQGSEMTGGTTNTVNFATAKLALEETRLAIFTSKIDGFAPGAIRNTSSSKI